MLKKTPNIAIVILAAGASRRMGTPKQLLSWGNDTLLKHAVKTAVDSHACKVIVVLGANYEAIENDIKSLAITILKNDNWELGLGKSIACAANSIINSNEDFDGVLITLADQPLIDTAFLNEFITNFIPNQNQIIATSYGEEKKGVPVLFDKNYFSELEMLSDDNGAKILLKKHDTLIEVLKFKTENLDIDLKTDYNHLFKASFGKQKGFE
ncbi:MAG: nucleotidyltransferase family protein [Algibacter sp.]